MPKLCSECASSNLVLTHTTFSAGPQQLHRGNRLGDMPRQAKSVPRPNFAKGTHRRNANFTVKVSTRLKPRTRVLYWGPKECTGLEDSNVRTKPDYGAYENFGTTRVRRDGTVTMRLRRPRVYMEKGTSFPRHVHFCTETADGKWSTRVWAAGAFPSARVRGGDISPSELHSAAKRGVPVHVVNALPTGYRGIDCPYIRMGRAHHVPHMSTQKVFDRFVSEHKLTTAPIVVYCIHAKCGAAKHAIEKLTKAGACNLFYMPAGTEGWYRQFS